MQGHGIQTGFIKSYHFLEICLSKITFSSRVMGDNFRLVLSETMKKSGNLGVKEEEQSRDADPDGREPCASSQDAVPASQDE